MYVPAIANFRMNRLNDRLAAANTAALVLDAAALGHGSRIAGAGNPYQHRRARRRHQDGQQRRSWPAPVCPHDRSRCRCANHDGVVAIVDTFEMMLESATRRSAWSVRPPPAGNSSSHHRRVAVASAMYRFSRNLLLVSLGIAMLHAGLVYLALHYLFVRPMRRLTASLVVSTKIRELGADHRASQRGDESASPSVNCPKCSAIWCRCCIRRAGSQPLARGVEDQPRPA